MSKVAVQLLSYDGERFLAGCLASLAAQTFHDLELYALDNASTDRSLQSLETARAVFSRPLKIFNEVKNLGFAGGHNKLFGMHASEYVLCLNQDVVLEPDYLERLVGFLDAHPRAGAVSGKLVRSRGDGARSIDSAGLMMRVNGQVIDAGAGEPDSGSYDGTREVFGVSGAVPLYRRASVRDVSPDGALFDGSFFAYKEDVDLAWRLRLRGWDAFVVGAAVAAHARGFKPDAPVGARSAFRQRLSSANHLRMLVKDLSRGEFRRFGARIVVHELAKLGYLFARRPAALAGYADFLRGLPDALRKRKVVQKNVTHPITAWIGRT